MVKPWADSIGHSRKRRSVARPSRTLRSQRPPTGSVSLSRDVAERQAGEHRRAAHVAQMGDRGVHIVAAVVVRQRVFGELPEQDRALPGEHAGVLQLVEHALDSVRRFADVLEEQDAAVDRREVRRAAQVRDQRKIAAPERSGASRCPGPSSAHRPSYRDWSSSPKQCSKRERRRLRRAEIARRRARERDHAGMRERRQLERREVAVARATSCRAPASYAKSMRGSRRVQP